MKFFQEELTDHEFKGGVIQCAIALSVTIPVLATYPIPHPAPIKVRLIIASTCAATCLGAYVFVLSRRLKRKSDVRVSPEFAFCLVATTFPIIMLVNLAASGPYGLYRSLFILPVLVLSGIGDYRITLYGWILGTAFLLASEWFSSFRDVDSLSVFIISSYCLFAGSTMLSHIKSSWSTLAHAKIALNRISDAAMSSKSLEEGLETCLPLLDKAFPFTKAVVFARQVDREFVPIASWPPSAMDDARLAQHHGFATAVESNRSFISPEHCAIPIGYYKTGELILAMERKKSRRLGHGYLIEMADALASCLLRLTNRTIFVAELEMMGRIDTLTGLPNRSVLNERLAAEASKASLGNGGFSVAMADIDNFKLYNDTFGHLAGDGLLASAAAAMVMTLTDTEALLARYGGEEFCLVLPDTPYAQAVAIANGLVEAVRHCETRNPATVSVGVATWQPGDDINKLLLRADAALYEAKALGKDRVA